MSTPIERFRAIRDAATEYLCNEAFAQVYGGLVERQAADHYDDMRDVWLGDGIRLAVERNADPILSASIVAAANGGPDTDAEALRIAEKLGPDLLPRIVRWGVSGGVADAKSPRSNGARATERVIVQ